MDFLGDKVESTIAGSLLASVSNMFVECYEAMYVGTSDFSKFSETMEHFEEIQNAMNAMAISDVLKTIGVALVILYFLVNLADDMMSRNISVETLVRAFIKLTVGLLIVLNVNMIIKAIVDFGTAFGKAMESAIATGTVPGDETPVNLSLDRTKFREGLNGADQIGYFGFAVKAFLPFLLINVNNIVMMFLALSRLFELALRSMFAPAAVADICKDGISSPGMRYLKKTLAVSLQYAVIVGISICVPMIMESSVFSSMNAIDLKNMLKTYSTEECVAFIDALFKGDHILRLGVLASKTLLSIKSLQICNDIVGV